MLMKSEIEIEFTHIKFLIQNLDTFLIYIQQSPRIKYIKNWGQHQKVISAGNQKKLERHNDRVVRQEGGDIPRHGMGLGMAQLCSDTRCWTCTCFSWSSLDSIARLHCFMILSQRISCSLVKCSITIHDGTFHINFTNLLRINQPR